MKISLFVVFAFISTSAMAEKVNDFNKVLMDEVKKDIREENAEYMKTRPTTFRGPASVTIENEAPAEEQNKIDKTVRQTGSTRW